MFFFPKGEKEYERKGFPLVPTIENNNIVWYKSKSNETFPNHQLTKTDGSEGWMAYALNNILFIKKFEDVPVKYQAPGEGEVLFYTSAHNNYIELEQQGFYNKLRPGEKTEWKVKWYLKNIPEDIKIEPGSANLLQLAKSYIKG